ncbi:MAG: division/cell wall cluster transcriptional repressor MraZ [Treponemataceae bacterium]|nr:division/cell wall cluster transcriptional repressor MraZ [Spirochaetales bacterium]MDY6030312.1 division/cell wall cluster transcriptional repressor MraZ [Treponemataceae bacterium]
MNLLTGEYNNTIDEKGRISFPAKLRTAVNQNVLVVTKGLDRCLWLFTSTEWEDFQSKLMSNASMMNSRNMQVVRHFVAPAQEIEFDKNGRLSIPQSLREYAGLSKDCTVLGVAKYMEIWDSNVYKDYLVSSEDSFREAAEGFNEITF